MMTEQQLMFTPSLAKERMEQIRQQAARDHFASELVACQPKRRALWLAWWPLGQSSRLASATS